MKKLFAILMAVAILSGLSFAQARGGDIYGTVVLADGSPLPGVTITLTGEKIGTKTTVSSEKGNFRFIQVPPGNYELRIEMDGFKTVIRKGIDVGLGKTVSFDVLMETSQLKEEITVTGRAGIIDTRKTQVGVNVDKDFVASIPTSRNPWTVLSALPGIVMDKSDVGGAESGQQSIFMAGGGDTDDTVWNVDGANITDPSAIGSAPAYLNINAYDELQVTVGANDITAQTGGVQLNFVTKRAGNQYSGDFHLYVEDQAWELKQDPTPAMAAAGLVVPGIYRLYQYGVGLGGPIIKDKLWWFGSWAIQDIHKRTEIDFDDATWLVSGYAKVNFEVGKTSGDFHMSYDNKQKWGRVWLGPAQQDTGSLWDQSGPGYLFYGGISHVFGELMMNLKAVYTDGGFNLTPKGAAFDPEYGYFVGNEALNIDFWSRAEGSYLDYKTNRNSINVSLDGNYFLEGALGGDHEIKFGVDYYTSDTTSVSSYPHMRYTYVYRDVPGQEFLQIFPDYVLDVNYTRISAYLQDTVTFGKLTASIGLRFDKETGKVNPFQQPGFTWHEPGSPHHGEQMWPGIVTELNVESFKSPASWQLLSPRISLAYDITGDGKNVVKLSAARYMSQSGNTLADIYVPYRYALADWNDVNGDEVPQYGEVGDLFWYDPYIQTDPVTGLNVVDFADDYNTPYLDELTLAFEKALSDDLMVSISGMYKKKHNLSQIFDTRGETTDVNKGIMPDGSLETDANWEQTDTFDVGGTTVPVYEQIVTPVGFHYFNMEKSYWRYYGVTLQLIKKLSNHWMANVSFTWQDWKWNWFEEDFVNMNSFNFFDGGEVAESTYGSGLRDLWVNSRWMVKLSGMYQLPWDINLTAFFQAREGYPQPLRTGTWLSQGPEYFYPADEKVGDDRLPVFWQLNLGLEKTIKVSDRVSATLVVDVYNISNNQIELKRSLSSGDPSMWTNAGLFQFGVRVNF
jgi:hypothetical protein